MDTDLDTIHRPSQWVAPPAPDLHDVALYWHVAALALAAATDVTKAAGGRGSGDTTRSSDERHHPERHGAERRDRPRDPRGLPHAPTRERRHREER